MQKRSSIVISGFVNTGRSAISTWVCGFRSVTPWPHRETRTIRCPGGLAWLSRRVVEGCLNNEHIAYFEDLMGGTLREEQKGGWNVADELDWSNMDAKYTIEVLGSQYNLIVQDFSKYLRKLVGTRIELDIFAAECGFFMGKLIELACKRSGKTTCVFANPFHGFDAENIKFLNQTTAVIVDRDPRDQFVDLVQRDILKDSDQIQFIKDFKRHHQAPWIAPSCAYTPFRSKVFTSEILYVSFDCFVSYSGYRAELVRMLGLVEADYGPEIWEEKFDSVESRKNVGLYRMAGAPSVSMIERELSTYLFS